MSISTGYPHATFNDMKSCLHPDPDIICLDCDCWKLNPFQENMEESKKELDKLIII